MANFDIAREKLLIRQEVNEGRRDLRNHLVPYFDAHEFQVQHYSDITNGLIKLLKNSEYLIDSIYYRIPTWFKFYSRQQYMRNDDGTEVSIGDWYEFHTENVSKNQPLIEIPQAPYYQCYEFSSYMTDENCSAELDLKTAVGPLSAYACYKPNYYKIHFLDFYGNEVTEISAIQEISNKLEVSAYSDVKNDISTQTTAIAEKVSAASDSYEGISGYYYLYKFDNDYPNPLSNVRDDIYFRGIYTYIADPIFKVHNYYNAYDGKRHGITVEFEESGTYHIEYSLLSDGDFQSDNILSDYTNDQEVSVYFKLSSYSEVLQRHIPHSNVGHGTIRIFSRHLVQEENRNYVLTDKVNNTSSDLSILI